VMRYDWRNNSVLFVRARLSLTPQQDRRARGGA
jgi:hypothetical protein